MEETGGGIMNGNTVGDEEGEWTFTGGRGNTVIHYVLGNEDTREKIERVEVGNRVESDHHPEVVWLRGEGEREEGGGRKKGGRRGGGRGNWSEEGRREFMRKFGRRSEGEGGVDDDWRELKERINRANG